MNLELLTADELYKERESRMTNARWRLSNTGTTEYGLREVAQSLFDVMAEIDRRIKLDQLD